MVIAITVLNIVILLVNCFLWGACGGGVCVQVYVLGYESTYVCRCVLACVWVLVETTGRLWV